MAENISYRLWALGLIAVSAIVVTELRRSP
jgi:hypothetical protein